MDVFFLKPDKDTQKEYVASKELILRYLNSVETIAALGKTIVNTIELFLKIHFFIHESHFVFYERLYTS